MFTCFFGSCFLILSVSLLKIILVWSSSDLGVEALLGLLLLDNSLFLFCCEKTIRKLENSRNVLVGEREIREPRKSKNIALLEISLGNH